MPEISAVVITCNSERYIRACLDSLLRQEYENYEIIIVDNGSRDSTVRLIREGYPQAALIVNPENAGACKARNQGIERASGPWILTLDCDVTLDSRFLGVFHDYIRQAPGSVGALQPKVLDAGGSRICSFGIDLSSLLRFRDRGKGSFDYGQFDTLEYIFGACSGAALYRKKSLESIREYTGFFDERFFFLVEDVDVAWRLKQKGWKTAFVPEAVCRHEGNSSGFNRQERQFLCWRNRKLFMKKNGIRRPHAVFLYDLPRFFWLMCTNSCFRRHIVNGTIMAQ